MRLLNTANKKLETFYGEDIPGYAILSHMWGKEEDEVLFKHIAGSDDDKSEGKARKGYAKIEGACKQAIEDGFEYIWIDTCCIDKASSAELSEAINSMFEWYQNSEVCYVYLEDVESDRDGQAKSNTNTTFPIVPFERSRWFTRGWTLQELIAPQSVVFYSEDWVDIGTKASLQHTISVVTRIRVGMLVAYDPEEASVAEKMSWAAFRKTTRVEDIAYCLMGLLGVNMPLLYGEGNRAFRRLQEEFMKVSDDDSLFAWASHLDYRLEGSRGMLANSPWEFRDGIYTARSKDGAYSPYSMTNQGLRIKLPLLPIDPSRDLIGIDTDSKNVFKAILKCVYIGNEEPARRIAIYLKKIREGYYQRIHQRWICVVETPSNMIELTTLLVPLGDTLTTRDPCLLMSDIEVEILPTMSGFTYDSRSLVDGYKDKLDLYFKNQQVIYFEQQGKCFGVVIGCDRIVKSDRDIPWLDFIDVIDEEESYNDLYKDGGSRTHLRTRYLDWLSEKIPGGDWWVTISLRKMSRSRRSSRMRVVIDFQRDKTKVPSAILASGGLFSDFLANYDSDDIHPDFKKEGNGWLALFNHTAKRSLDIDLVYTFPHKSEVLCVQFSSDGKYFAISSDMLRVYDMETGTERFESIKTATIYSVCFSPNGKFVATGDDDGCTELWDIGAKRIHKALRRNHQEIVHFICFSFDGHFLITGSKDTVQIWEIDNDTSISRILTIPSDHRVGITSISISPTGSLVAAGTSEGIICVWDVVTTQLLEKLPKHGNDVRVAFTPDGKGLVSGSDDGTLKYWDTGRLVPAGIKRKFDELSDSGASSMVASSNIGKKNRHRWTITVGHETPVTSVAVSHDRRWVISGLANGHYVWWDLRSGSSHFVLDLNSAKSKTCVSLLSTSSASNILATFKKGDNMVRVWRYKDI